jgi:hypothetical protein
MARIAKPDGLGETVAFKWTGRALVIETDLKPAVVAFNDEGRRGDSR